MLFTLVYKDEDYVQVMWKKIGDGNSSVGSVLHSLSFVVQHCGFDPPLSLWYRKFFPWS